MSKGLEIVLFVLLGLTLGTALGTEFMVMDIKHQLENHDPPHAHCKHKGGKLVYENGESRCVFPIKQPE